MLFAVPGHVLLVDFDRTYRCVQSINHAPPPEERIGLAQFYAFGLLHEIFHVAIRFYETHTHPHL
ncbi:hypothetical protein [Pajaroellobacter abortibovis]|uniref:hypothetical protein n=1 Tax=Pajaroellobacter abortibovis TaxID=1882918 RepID=UPI0012EB70F1|nr:hypothetical protein [Pajaroellobacter abortibovis]